MTDSFQAPLSITDGEGRFQYYTSLLELALDEAKQAFDKDEVPVGAVIVDASGQIVGRGHNLKETLCDATAHAEIIALKDAQKTIGDWRLNGCVMVSTLEPCPMCLGALIHSRLETLVYGAKDLKWGAVETKVRLNEPGVFNHYINSLYMPHEGCVSIIKIFFKNKRNF